VVSWHTPGWANTSVTAAHQLDTVAIGRE